MKLKIALISVAILSGCGYDGGRVPSVRMALPAVADVLPPVALSDTTVHELPSAATGRRYRVWVDRPASYDASDRRFPVVFVTDASWSFGMVRSIRNLMGRRGRNIEDFILVGLTYEDGIEPHDSRSRDYTPSDPLTDPTRDPGEYTAAGYGQAEAYRTYVERQVFPLIAANYRADMSRRTYLGHSYGGLFGAYVLLTRPGMFDTYILGSPSLWFDRKRAFGLERDYAAAHRDLRARVMMVTGSHEVPGTGPRNNEKNDLVADMRAFEAVLRSRGYPGLTIASQVVADEDHLTVYPDVAARGLFWALPGTGPYAGG